MAWLTEIFIIIIGGMFGYYTLIALGNKHRAQMVKVFLILMVSISTLQHAGPAVARMGVHYNEVRDDVQSLTNAINSVGDARNKLNEVTGNIGNSSIVNFGSNPKLPAKSLAEMFTGGHLEWPISGKVVISQSFSPPDHHGIDIATPERTSVMAARDGWVRETGVDPSGIYGNYVMIDHGGGWQTLYAHCSELKTKQGKNVFAKDVIALSGDTGNSTGPHLHFEVRFGGKTVDPMAYLK
ncbi:murein DD-endopeptidase MepM [Desulfosporosinus acididurans]|uniref:Murein DD-endopeptidase MepM n=1 Tax=Desulfosporosinus acididurans TaxID=476652 RepID=A0A0J1FU11_9FIRM|nr:M23 family metallopeptidase [Desulfosporosinus acididurans]KLU66787.1 murein DD-endopeptidase MepM [Desulfosporosinus acididurans]